MIVQVKFKGIITEGKTKSELPDSVKIHAAPEGKERTKELFLSWVERNAGIKGDSGVFHPLNGFGTIKILKVEECDG